MTILTLNSGSSSLKAQLYDFPADQPPRPVARAAVERIGAENAGLSYIAPDGSRVADERAVGDHLAGVHWVLAQLAHPTHGAVASLADIEAVGHRVVHGGEEFSGSLPATPAVIDALEAHAHLAPLHNPPNLAGIRACAEALPDARQVCIFDTGLHHSLDPEVYLYVLPYELYTQHKVRRYGFHGIAMRSLAEQAELVLGRPREELRLVNLMLGSGTTANALAYGRSVAISTGLTPLEGLIQSTRCGDLDPGIVLYLLRRGYTPAQLAQLFNRRSGLLGISGLSLDVRDLKENDGPAARLALDLLAYSVSRYVGAYAADMAGLDVLTLGGGIAQHNPDLRAAVCTPLRHLGVEVDAATNDQADPRVSQLISTPESRVAVVLAAVDEELVMARDTRDVVRAQAEATS